MWTDERVETLRKLWLDGLSAAQIARQLGGVTRNAVIGKIHRLGLTGRVQSPRPTRSRKGLKRLTPAQRHLFQPNPPHKRASADLPNELELIRAMPPLDPTLGVADLTDHQCRFPIGDPLEPGFAFCGRMATCAPYCADHARLTYQPGAKRPAPDALEKLARAADRRRMREAMAVLG